jgi:hypothetical protein
MEVCVRFLSARPVSSHLVSSRLVSARLVSHLLVQTVRATTTQLIRPRAPCSLLRCRSLIPNPLPLLARCAPVPCSSSESADSALLQYWTNRKNAQAGSTRLLEVPGTAGECDAPPSQLDRPPLSSLLPALRSHSPTLPPFLAIHQDTSSQRG